MVVAPGEEIYLSVVIPTYNEERRIGDTLRSVADYFLRSGWAGEVVVADDGSSDRTLEVVRGAAPPESQVLTGDPSSHGKGGAVRRGLASARGRYIVFTDADLSTPIEEADKLLRALAAGADLAIGSRRLATSEVGPRSPVRRLLGWGFSFLARTLVVPGIQDSQCGFKGYRREAARRLASLQRVSGFSFDVEHLYLARRLGYRVEEIGVRWIDSPGTTIKLGRDSWRMLRDLLRIRVLHGDLTNRRAN